MNYIWRDAMQSKSETTILVLVPSPSNSASTPSDIWQRMKTFLVVEVMLLLAGQHAAEHPKMHRTKQSSHYPSCKTAF